MTSIHDNDQEPQFLFLFFYSNEKNDSQRQYDPIWNEKKTMEKWDK